MRHFRNLAHRVLTLILGISVTGCYSLQPIGTDRPDVGRSVQLTLTDAGVRAVALQRRYPQGRTLTGTVLWATGDTLVLRAKRQKRRRFNLATATADTLTLPYSLVEAVHTRQLDVGQTGFLVTGVVGAYVAIVGGIFSVDNSGPGGGSIDDRGGDVNVSIP